ncbi:hypothetical protein [Jidongwangia harbinensis]|uniref:hypothetical protein n=1 Tax=Jidongwangia harbinensis TaxID=2878561 RepID=UPI001CD9E995|nr:hypothetical protein [Jidongwangia harbinensis]MCA2218185.1 hypothetical protein [Jidongwangia harbinensis]
MVPSVLIGLVLVLWLSTARTRRLRWLVAAGLAALAAAAALLATAFPPALVEITLMSMAVAMVVVAVAGARQRRRLGPAPASWARWPFRIAACLLVMSLCAIAVVLRPGPFLPSTDTVLPLPAGLHAAVEPPDDGSCGTGSCTQTITVTGPPGQPGADVYAAVRRHVADRGWGRGCRRAGWLLDRTTACIELAQRDDRVMIHLSGDRDDLAHLVTLE